MAIASISGLPAFLLYFCVSLGLVAIYLVAYVFATAHDEFTLIRKNVPAAAVSLGLSLVGFALPLSKAISQAANVIDFVVWGVVALIVQIVVYWLIRLVLPDLSKRIAAGELAPAIFLGAASLTAGIINAASMSA